MAKKGTTRKATKASSKGVKISLDEALRAIAANVVNEHGLPKGVVTRLLKQNKVENAIIERVATRLIPYGYTK